MPFQQDVELVAFLREGTEKGKIEWKPTANKDEYTASFRGKWSVTVNEVSSSLGDLLWILRVADTDDREMLRLSSSEYGPIEYLFDLARRAALKVDLAIADILDSLK